MRLMRNHLADHSLTNPVIEMHISIEMCISEVRSNHVTLSQQSQSNSWSIANEPELFRLIVDGPTQVEIQPIALRCASQCGERQMCMKCGREVSPDNSMPVEEGFFHGCRLCLACVEQQVKKAEHEANGKNFVLVGKQLVLR